MVKNPRLTFLDTLFSRPLLSSLYLSLKWPQLKKKWPQLVVKSNFVFNGPSYVLADCLHQNFAGIRK